MVSQALEAGRLDRRFPNNPEIDVRNYVDEKKFEIGAERWSHFLTQPAKVDSPIQRTIHHEDAETVFG
jgi:hypothetical protein